MVSPKSSSPRLVQLPPLLFLYPANLTASQHPMLPAHLFLRCPIQKAQISLPPNRHHARKDTPILRIHKREAKSRHRRPQLAAVHHAHRHRPLDALPDFGYRVAGEEGLHAEEIGVENGRETDLVDRYFRREGEEMRGIIEVVAEKHEPRFRYYDCTPW